MRNNDKTKARAEEREKNIGWIKRLFTAWRVSHAERTERRAEREEAGEDDLEEDPVVIPSSTVTMHPKGTPAPASPSAVEVQVSEERVDLSNDMIGRQMIAVGVRRVILARGELDKLEGPKNMPREEGRVAPKGGRSRESKLGIGRRRRRRRTRQTRATRDRGGNDRRENDESGTTARWHEGCSD